MHVAGPRAFTCFSRRVEGHHPAFSVGKLASAMVTMLQITMALIIKDSA